MSFRDKMVEWSLFLNSFIHSMDIGKCTKCAKRQKLVMPCTSCTNKFCSTCIQLEVHECPEMTNRKMIEREKLTKQNPVVIAPKVQFF